MKPYYSLPSLDNFYFEDSYVLDIIEKNDEITFIIEAVITKKSDLYKKPKPNEQYYYKKIKLSFF